MIPNRIKIRIKNITSIGLLLIFSVLSLTSCNYRPENSSVEDKMIGVKIYDHNEDFDSLVNDWKDIGINTVFTSPQLFSDKIFRTIIRKNDITSFIILPIFFNPDALQENPDLYAITNKGEQAKDEWVTFVCPSREEYRKMIIDSVKTIIKELDPDGISLDFIRHFVYWEKIYPERTFESLPNTCFDSTCLNKFQADTKIDIPDSLKTEDKIYDWIKVNCLYEWGEWKCEQITGLIAEISKEARKLKPDILINVHAVPWRQNDFSGAIKTVAGQDFSEISDYVDYLSPMTYAHMVKREPSWIHSVTNDISNQVNCKVIPSIQVNKAYLDTELTLEEFRESLKEALATPSGGVIFWSWEQLSKKPDKRQIIKQSLDGIYQ
ncbi:MAG: hypothetical protein J7K53_02740 [Bacteroidales bacterium]|nr:hypothetical protein [Bacteroidales bacterium]